MIVCFGISEITTTFYLHPLNIVPNIMENIGKMSWQNIVKLL